MLEAGKTPQQEIMRIQIVKMQNPFFTMLSACGMCYEVSYLGDSSDILGLWSRIFILNFTYILRTFPLDPRLFSEKRRNIFIPTQLIVGWRLSIDDWKTSSKMIGDC
jgi:hypothetical protein